MANPTYQSGFYAPGRGTAKYPALWDGCVGAWDPGLGNTGLVLRDWSSGQNNGTLTNGPTWGVSDGRQALSFDGSNDYVTIAPSIILNDCTASVWVNPSIYTAYASVLNNDFNGQGGLQIGWSGTTNKFMGGVKTTSFPYGSVASQASTLGRLTHLVLTRTGTANLIYVDGIAGVVKTGGSGATTLNRAWTIGTTAVGVLPFTGSIYDIAVFDRVLSYSEIKLLGTRPDIAYELAPRKFYSLPAVATSRQYRLFRPAILRGA